MAKFNESDILQKLPKQFFANLVAKVNAKVASGADVINLGQGNPDQPTPDFIVEAMQKAVADPTNHKYSSFRGLTALKEAVAILGGSKTGLVELPLALLNPGDTLLLPDPGYPDYFSSVALAGVKLELFSLLAENNFLPDYSSIDDVTLDAAKLLYLNYPNNPTGATATSEIFAETVALANEREIGIVHDFAYGAIGYDGQKPLSFLQTPGAKEVGIEFYTLSKTFNMAGWRIGFAVGNADMIEAINLIQDHLFVSVFPAIQKASITALNEGNAEIEKLVALYEQRRNDFCAAAKKIGWEPYPSSGSFYVWMPVPEGYTSESFADLLLDKAVVCVAPGNGFGEHGEGFVRVGLLIDEPRFTEACQRIGELHLFD